MLNFLTNNEQILNVTKDTLNIMTYMWPMN